MCDRKRCNSTERVTGVNRTDLEGFILLERYTEDATITTLYSFVREECLEC
jgi:hypothetical protein